MNASHERSTIPPVVIAAAAGIVLWLATSFAAGGREAWDAPGYWTVAYPVAIAICAVLGYLHPQRPGLWALVLFESQLVGMWIGSGEIGGLWPLGMLVLAAIALPGVAAAVLASRLRRRHRDDQGLG